MFLYKNLQYFDGYRGKQSQTEFAQDLGITKSMWSSYIDEKRVKPVKISAETLIAISNRFGVTIDDLITRDIEKNPRKIIIKMRSEDSENEDFNQEVSEPALNYGLDINKIIDARVKSIIKEELRDYDQAILLIKKNIAELTALNSLQKENVSDLKKQSK